MVAVYIMLVVEVLEQELAFVSDYAILGLYNIFKINHYKL